MSAPHHRLKILSLSAVYPTPEEPNLGIFVKRRLDHMAALADIRVVAPAPAIDYAKLRASGKAINSRQPKPGDPAATTVLRPRWWYPPGGGALNPPLLAAQLLPTLRRERPFDVIDAHFAYPTGVAAAILSKALGGDDVPFTITLRGDETMHAGVSTLRARWIDWALRRATAIFAVSGRLRDWAISREGVSPDRAFTIPNGVDNTIFRLLPDTERIQAREDLQREIQAAANPADRIVLSVGYLIERKGHHHLIRAVHELNKRSKNKTQVVIAGEPGREGNFADHLHQLTASLGMQDTVHFLGGRSQQQVAALMNAADLMVLASSREGWPNVVQEALACGCPVVASDIGGTPDMIPDERYGHLLPSGDVQADTLMKALERGTSTIFNRQAIAEWGSRRSWNQVARDVVARMQDVLPPTGSVGFSLRGT